MAKLSTVDYFKKRAQTSWSLLLDADSGPIHSPNQPPSSQPAMHAGREAVSVTPSSLFKVQSKFYYPRVIDLPADAFACRLTWLEYISLVFFYDWFYSGCWWWWWWHWQSFSGLGSYRICYCCSAREERYHLGCGRKNLCKFKDIDSSAFTVCIRMDRFLLFFSLSFLHILFPSFLGSIFMAFLFYCPS